MDLGRIETLLGLLVARGFGVTITPVTKGTLMGGVGSDHHYQFDGWEIGYISGIGGGELAVGKTLPEAIDVAIDVLLAENEPEEE